LIAGLVVFATVARGGMLFWAMAASEVVVFFMFILFCSTNVVNSFDLRRRDKGFHFKRTGLDIPILLLIILGGISVAVSVYKEASILSFLRIVTYVFLFYIVVNVFNRKMIVSFAVFFIALATILSFFGLLQYFFRVNHSWWVPNGLLASTYVNHNHFAGLLEMSIPVSLGLFLGIRSEVFSIKKALFYRFLIIVSLIVSMLAFVFSQSRGGWVSLVVALFCLNVVLLKKKIFTKKVLLLFLLAVLFIAIYIYVGEDSVAKRFRTFENIASIDFLDSRLYIWKGSLNIIRNSPFVGNGLGTFLYVFPQYRPVELPLKAFYAHNDYLQMMVEMGPIGLMLMLFVILRLLRIGFTNFMGKNYQRGEGIYMAPLNGIIIGFTTSILSISLHNLVDFNFHIFANMMIVSVLSGIIVKGDIINEKLTRH